MEFTRKSTIAFTAIVGDETVGSIMNSYIHGACGIMDDLNSFIPKSVYGDDLDILLIALYVEGSHDWFKIPNKAKINRYSKKEKGIRYDVPATKSNFFSLSKSDRKEFLIQHVNSAISATRFAFQKKNLHADFDALHADFEKAAVAYRARPLPEN